LSRYSVNRSSANGAEAQARKSLIITAVR